MKPLTFMLLGVSLYLGGCAGPIEQWKKWRYPDYGLERDPHPKSNGEEDANATRQPPPRP